MLSGSGRLAAATAAACTRGQQCHSLLVSACARWIADIPYHKSDDTFSVQPGSLLHICCTHPSTHLQVSNRPGIEEAVTMQVDHGPAFQRDSSLRDRFLIQQIPGGRIIDVVEQAAVSCPSAKQEHTVQQQKQQQQQQPGHSTNLSCTIPSRFCGLSATTAGGSVTVGQLQEADMQLSTAGGAVQVKRCRAHNASINTAVQAMGQQQQQPAELHLQGGSIQVGELSASRVSVYSGGGSVSIKRLFGLTVDVLSAGASCSIGSVYADRATISTGGHHAAAASVEGRRDSSGGAAAAVGGGSLHVGHMACLKGEARLESGGGPLSVDGLEGNAVLLSSGGDIKVHLHEQAGLVYVDSDGGCVTAWLSPSGTPLGLQVKAAGGVVLDPALKVTGEVGPTMLFGMTSGDGSISSMSTQTSAMVQEAVAAAKSSSGSADLPLAFNAGQSSSGHGCSPEAARWKQNEQQVAAWARASQAGAGAAAEDAGAATSAAPSAGSGCGCSRASSPAATRQLIINAGWGRVELKAMGWMDGLKARMQAKQAAEGVKSNVPCT